MADMEDTARDRIAELRRAIEEHNRRYHEEAAPSISEILGPRALALLCDLNKAKGLSVRKTCAVLLEHFGLPFEARRDVGDQIGNPAG